MQCTPCNGQGEVRTDTSLDPQDLVTVECQACDGHGTSPGAIRGEVSSFSGYVLAEFTTDRVLDEVRVIAAAWEGRHLDLVCDEIWSLDDDATVAVGWATIVWETVLRDRDGNVLARL